MLGLLMLVGLTNYMDRLSISVLQVPIKAELGLSDTQLGAITGLSFSLIYTLAALPIARLADRFSPKLVLIVCLVTWNLLTMLCGLANGMLMLAVVRMGVAIGEAGCSPATQALIAHRFPAHQRGRAIAIWQMVFPFGTLLGIASSGFLSAYLGWRLAFVVLGGIGIAVAPLIAMFLKDGGSQQTREAQAEQTDSTWIELCRLFRARSFGLLLAAGFFGAIPLNAVLTWNAPFYDRAFGLPMSEVTIIAAGIAGIGGGIGMFGGGFFGDAMGRRDARWYCWIPAMAMAAAPVLVICQFVLAGDAISSALAGLCAAILLNCWIPPQAAIVQSLVRPSARALAAGCIVLTAGLGSAVGPFATGIASDIVVAAGFSGGVALGYAVTLVSLSGLLCAMLFALAGASLRSDLVQREDFDREIAGAA